MTTAAQCLFIRCDRGAEAPLYPYSPDHTNPEDGLAASENHRYPVLINQLKTRVNGQELCQNILSL
jgi:hypothetical protein